MAALKSAGNAMATCFHEDT